MAIELQEWSGEKNFHLVMPDGTDLGVVYDKDIGEDIVRMINAACALRPQDWKLSTEITNNALNAFRDTEKIYGIDIPEEGGIVRTAGVMVVGDQARAELILTAVNAYREMAERITNQPKPQPYYLLRIIGDIEPVLCGPYPTEEERDNAARNAKAIGGDEDGLFALDLASSTLTVEAYSAGFFDTESDSPEGDEQPQPAIDLDKYFLDKYSHYSRFVMVRYNLSSEEWDATPARLRQALLLEEAEG